MARILTGIQSTGIPHLGNLLGAVLPAIKMAKDQSNESFLFIADLHSITQIKNGNELSENTFATAATWLACAVRATAPDVVTRRTRPEHSRTARRPESLVLPKLPNYLVVAQM